MELEGRKITKRFIKSRQLLSLKNNKDNSLVALHDVDFKINDGEIVGLVGESGSGKTTLAKILNKLLSPTEGKVICDGDNIAPYSGKRLQEYRKKVQLIFQNVDSALHPYMTVGEMLEEACSLGGYRRSAKELIDSVRLSRSYLSRLPAEMSGGEKRRVGIARVLAVSPKLIIADEPLAGLDARCASEILDLLLDIVEEQQVGMIYISHDLGSSSILCKRAYVLLKGRLVTIVPGKLLLDKESGHPYVQELARKTFVFSGLMSSSGRNRRQTTRRTRRVYAIEVPGIHDGCVYAGRCERYHRMRRPKCCIEEFPEMMKGDKERLIACHFLEDGDS